MKAYRSAIKSALASGKQVHVDYDDEIIKCGSSFQQAVDAVEAIESCWILVVSPSTKNPGKWVRHAALYCIPELDDDESIADYLCNKDPDIKNWADKWFAAYCADSTFAGAIS